MGIPAKSAKGLSGSREDAILAGINTVKVMEKWLKKAQEASSSWSVKARASFSSKTGMPSRMG
jgi:hypothetical protein